LNTLKALCTAITLSISSVAFAGEPILSVTGDAAASASGQGKLFERAELEAMPRTTIETTTIWTDGVQRFEGVSLHDLLNHVGAQSGTIRAVALNDYAVEIPTSDAVEGGPIVAFLRDGQMMSVRDKGPLWIVYPYDANEAYQSEEIYARSIWQLNRLQIEAQ